MMGMIARNTNADVNVIGLIGERGREVKEFIERDLGEEGVPLMSVADMQQAYNRQLKAPSFAASAINGQGVNDTLKTCLVSTLKSLRKEAGWT
jgi:flagellar biosynthesis/type III secretory pathway ATPase